MLPCVKLIAFLAIFITPARSTPHPILAVLSYDGSEITVNPTNDECQAARECVDCNTGRVCIRSSDKLLQFATVRCSADQSTPYCNPENGQCTSVAPNNCLAQDFVCPDTDGTYPDPSSCTVYHICVNGFRVTNSCPLNNVYDHSVGECRPRRSTRCQVMNCSGKDGQPVIHPADDRIWGICVNQRAYILGRCKDYQKYDLQQRRCVRVCRAVGKQPHDTECQKYVLCASSSPGRYTDAVQSCPCNEGFDETVNECSKTAKCLASITPLCPTGGSSGNGGSGSGGSGNGGSGNGSSGSGGSGNEGSGNGGSGNAGSGNGNNDNNGNAGNDGSAGSGNDNNNGGSNAGGNGDNSGSRRRRSDDPVISPLIINNSGSANSDNNVSNGDDEVKGNIVNGNGNGANNASGNVQAGEQRPVIVPLIINNSGSGNKNNSVSNGDDDVKGNLVNGNNNDGNSGSGNVNKDEHRPQLSPLIINNAGSGNKNNSVSNGDDDVKGNLVNGNNNGGNSDSGNVNKDEHRPQLSPLIINNAGSGNKNNSVSNGDDDVKGNLVNGNNNDGNSGSGNVNKEEHRPQLSPLIINNAGSGNKNNSVSNGDDDVKGNLVNGNNNDGNSGSGNVIEENQRPHIIPLIINNSGNKNDGNDVSNGNDDVKGNLVNGNGNGHNSNSGNVNKVKEPPQLSPLIINNSGNKNDGNDISNGNDDVKGNLVNGNGNGHNSNSGNVNKAKDPPQLSPLIINNSGHGNKNNNVSNGNDDVHGNLVNGNGNDGNSDSGNVQKKRDIPEVVPLIINNSGNSNKNNSIENGSDRVEGNAVNGNNNGENENSGNIGSSDKQESHKDENNDVDIIDGPKTDRLVSSTTAAPEDSNSQPRNSFLRCIDRIVEWVRSLFRPRS